MARVRPWFSPIPGLKPLWKPSGTPGREQDLILQQFNCLQMIYLVFQEKFKGPLRCAIYVALFAKSGGKHLGF